MVEVLPQIVLDYLDMKRLEDKSKALIKNYSSDIKYFLASINKNIEDVVIEEFEDYITKLKREKNIAVDKKNFKFF